MEKNEDLQNILNDYKSNNFEVEEWPTLEEYSKYIKQNLEESFGGKHPSFNGAGLVINIPVSKLDKSILIEYTKKDNNNISNMSLSERMDAIKNIYSTSFADATISDEMLKISCEKMEDFILDTAVYECIVYMNMTEKYQQIVRFAFLHDSTGNVPVESIVVVDGIEKILLYSETFINKFESETERDYIVKLVLTSISFLLEKFKK